VINEQGKRVKVIHVLRGPKQPERELTELEQLQYLKERAEEGTIGSSGNVKGNIRDDRKRWERYYEYKTFLESRKDYNEND
jgi:hypothetical protein